MTDNRNLLTLISEQREELQRWAQSRALPAGDVFRARLVLALADGHTYREIASSLKTSFPTIARWKMRFERGGLAGLEGRHRGSKPSLPQSYEVPPYICATTERSNPLIFPC
jgi:hypothetical protein